MCVLKNGFKRNWSLNITFKDDMVDKKLVISNFQMKLAMKLLMFPIHENLHYFLIQDVCTSVKP